MVCRHPLTVFFALACGISWSIWAPLWLPALGMHGLPVLPFHQALGALGPITAAFLVASAESGSRGPLDLLRHMGAVRGRLGWIAVALLGPPVLYLIAVAGITLAGSSITFAGFGTSTEFPRFGALTFLAYNVLSFGFGEETGWRGFALPRLQARHSALVASLLLTVGWAVWHVPLFMYRAGYTSMNAVGVVGWFASLLTGSILLTWLYNGSRGSILVVALFHASVDVVFTSGVRSPALVRAMGALITVWGAIILAVTGPRCLSRSGKMISAAGALRSLTCFSPRARSAPAAHATVPSAAST